jgi:hypothetical protein
LWIDDEAREFPAGASKLEPAQDVDEADAIRGHPLAFSGVDHDQPYGVVDDAEHGELSGDPVRRLAAQNIHPHRRLEMTQVRLDLPSQTVELGHRLLGILLRIEQGGHERHLACPKATSRDAIMKLTNPQQLRQIFPGLTGKPGRDLGGLDPVDDLIVLAETPNPDRLRSLPVPMFGVRSMGTEINTSRADGYANDEVQLQAEELSQIGVGAIQTVSHNDIMRSQEMMESLHDHQLVVTHRRRNQVEQSTRDEIEQCDESRDRQLVSSVPRRPAEQGMQFLCVRHRERRSVNAHHAVATPEPNPRCVLRHALSGHSQQIPEDLHGQPLAGLAIRRSCEGEATKLSHMSATRVAVQDLCDEEVDRLHGTQRPVPPDMARCLAQFRDLACRHD